MFNRLILIHKNVDPQTILRIEERQIAAFYDPIGGLPIGDINEVTFFARARYYIPWYQAAEFARLVREGTVPEEIVNLLRLEYRDPKDFYPHPPNSQDHFTDDRRLKVSLFEPRMWCKKI